MRRVHRARARVRTPDVVNRDGVHLDHHRERVPVPVARAVVDRVALPGGAGTEPRGLMQVKVATGAVNLDDIDYADPFRTDFR